MNLEEKHKFNISQIDGIQVRVDKVRYGQLTFIYTANCLLPLFAQSRLEQYKSILLSIVLGYSPTSTGKALPLVIATYRSPCSRAKKRRRLVRRLFFSL